jgi:hypothetical protein
VRGRLALSDGSEEARYEELHRVIDREAIRLLIRLRLQDGRLPHDDAPSARGSPGDGAICTACGEIITAKQVMMEVGPFPGEKESLCFHRLFSVMECGEADEAQIAPIVSADSPRAVALGHQEVRRGWRDDRRPAP